jgi:hypothetical protein
MNVPQPESQMSPTNKLLQQILDVSKQNLAATQELLTVAQSSNDYLKQITGLIQGFAHNYTVTVEQVVLTKPKPSQPQQRR